MRLSSQHLCQGANNWWDGKQGWQRRVTLEPKPVWFAISNFYIMFSPLRFRKHSQLAFKVQIHKNICHIAE